MAKRIRTTSGSSDFSRSLHARTARSAVLGFVGLAILSCGGDDTSAPPPATMPPPPPTGPVAASVTLEPAEVAVVAGDTIRVRARVFNDRAQVISDAAVTWASSDPAVATVDATGLVTGLKEGNASLTATSGPVSNAAPVAVHSPDRETLMDLYVDTRGGEWTNNDGWGTDAAIGSWYGVTANANSRVTVLNLTENGLNGQLPAELGSLAFLTELVVDANENLSGPIPVSLSELAVETLNYGGTMLCTVRDEGFQAWLNGVPAREGEFFACNEERSDLVKLYEALGGESWTESANWGTDAPLENWFGIRVDSAGRVTEILMRDNNLRGEIPPEIQYFPYLRRLRLDYNELEGEVPPEIGKLTELRRMDIDGNNFTGPIPPEFGNLVNLDTLWMGGNRMSGPIPPELGNLANLLELHLYDADFEGSIPEEFGNLAELQVLRITETKIEGGLPESLSALTKLRAIRVYGNELTDPLPAWLGQLDSLRTLFVSDNKIEGPIPAELGQIDSLVFLLANDNELSGPLPPGLGDAGELYRIWVQGNADLSGPLPEDLTRLEELWELIAEDTGLCMPRTPAFRAWMESVYFKTRIRLCGGEAHAEAYLIQAAQSREFPVPLVAGRDALLRVFVTSEQETGAMLPPVRATFFVDGAEVHVENIAAGSSPIPAEVREGELDLSPHAVIPADVIRPGLEMVVEIDPDGTLDPNLGVSRRIPETGRAAVDVRAVPPLLLTLVPFVRTADDDRAAVSFVADADADDEFFFPTRTYLPVGEMEIIKHGTVTVDASSMREIRDRVGAIRVMEDGIGHWMGLTPTAIDGVGGIATLPFFTDNIPYNGKAAASRLDAETFAHELGHNMSLFHALCSGDEGGPDVSYPYEGGRIGVWGWDSRDGGSLVDPTTAVDFMTYCDPTWVSDYYFTNALRFRIQDTLEVRRPPAASRTLLVSGGFSGDGAPWLDPAFVVDTRPVAPPAGGPWRLNGRRADGSELFSISFRMVEVWDGDGGGAFTFALPVDPVWETELASLSLAGPGGAVEIAEGSEPPMAILRDPDTRQVRAILTDLPAGPLARSAAGARAPEPGLEVMVSSGLPGASAWRR